MTPPVFLTGPRKLVDLRLLTVEDLSDVLPGVNDPEIQAYMAKLCGPVSEQFEQNWLKRVSQPSETDIVLGVVERGTGRLAGCMGLHQIDLRNRNASTGAFLWNKDCFGLGLGTDAKFAFLHWAFMAMPLRKVYSQVYASNPRSKAYQEKTGYKEIGRRQEHVYRNGAYVDEIQMEVFRVEFMAAYEVYMS